MSGALPRKSQRQPLACSECTRRKLRCSKKIPCSCCIERGRANLCHRELVEIRKKTPSRTRQSIPTPESSVPAASRSSSNHVTEEAPTILEFLALGRQNVLKLGDTQAKDFTSSVQHSWDLIFSIDQARLLLN